MVKKNISLDDETVAPAPSAAEQETADINAQIAAEVSERIKSRSFRSTATVGKAGLFDIDKYCNGIDYTVGGRLELRWCADNAVNIANKRMKGFMFPEEASLRLKNVQQNGLVLMVRTKEAAVSHRAELRRLAHSLDGQEFENSPVVTEANAKVKSKSGKVFRDFDKIEA